MRIKEVKLYQYAELDRRAKAKARDWLREAQAGDNFFAEYVTEEFKDEILPACGFTLQSGPSWSGFWSQGDGACFGGTWRASACKPQEYLKVRPIKYRRPHGKTQICEANKRWHDAIAPLVELAAKYPHAYASFSADDRGKWMRLESFDTGIECDDDWYDKATPEERKAATDDNDAAGEAFIDAAREIANAFYRTLEAEYDYQYSDKQIAEAIRANEYEFTRDGERG